MLATTLCGSTCVGAQQFTLEPSPAAQCLVRPEGGPDYPFAAFKTETKGLVSVALVFKTATDEPSVEVLKSEGGDDFEAEVRKHVKSYRVPCLTDATAPARLNFNFSFQPDSQKAHWDAPDQSTDESRLQMSQCIQHRSGRKAPRYPGWAAQGGFHGRILARLTFHSADSGPEFHVYGRPNSGRLTEDVEEWVKGLRMPCHTGEPISLTKTYVFLLDSEAYGFKPGLDFRRLLPMIKGIHRQHVAFDTTQMGCPFDVALHYRQPDLPNHVAQLGTTNPARRPLLKWLADSQFDLPEQTMDGIYGDSLKFTVPCIKLNLQPKEKT